MSMMYTQSVALWQAKGGKHFIELFEHETDGKVTCYSYRGRGCGGNLGMHQSRALAIQAIENGALRALKIDFPSTKRIEPYTTMREVA